MAARALMFQGTGSSVGKSLLVAGLARALRRRGLAVAPFKPQNMSNNAAVTPDGGEIGRAQALQARAAGLLPSVHMNPVLLKPQSEIGAQIVVQGRVQGQASARAFQARKQALLPRVLESYATLAEFSDIILVEGAGSAAEINLRAQDIANMGFARAANVPVILVGDIERGGVIASLVGTKAVLDPDDAALVHGFIVNKMRGDSALFADGLSAIESHTGWRSFGLVPFFPAAARLPAEDAADLDTSAPSQDSGELRIAVPALPFIANFDDLDPLAAEPDVRLSMVPRGTPLPACDLIILPGSKSTIADLAALRTEGWDGDIITHHRRGGTILGICGGFQMLGRTIADPLGVEGPAQTVSGLGLLAVDTQLSREKQLKTVSGHSIADNAELSGYEMHTGTTGGGDCARPVSRLSGDRMEGATSADGRVVGTYIHGLFAGRAQRGAWLARFGATAQRGDHDAMIETVLDELAAHLERHVNIDALLSIAR